MSDWQTVKQAILAETQRPNDGAAVERAMCEAMRFNRSQQVWFNEGSETISTVADQYDYQLPSDFLFMIGDPYYSPSGATNSRYTLLGRSRQFIEDNKYITQGVIEDTLQNGHALYFATDDSKIYLLPIPTDTGDSVSFRYVKDLGTPYPKYSGSAWSIYDPDTHTALAATYTNPWLDEGQDATRLRSLYTFYTRNLGNEKAGAAALQQWLEAMRVLKARSAKAKGRVKVRGHF